MTKLKYLSEEKKRKIIDFIERRCELYPSGYEPWTTYWRKTLKSAKNGFDFTDEELVLIYDGRLHSGCMFAPWHIILGQISKILKKHGWEMEIGYRDCWKKKSSLIKQSDKTGEKHD